MMTYFIDYINAISCLSNAKSAAVFQEISSGTSSDAIRLTKKHQIIDRQENWIKRV